jgi:molybdopterin synthase catalytic subunit
MAPQEPRTASAAHEPLAAHEPQSVIALSAEALDPEALVRSVRTDAHGAVVTFLGTTRETSPDDPRPVEALDYEAYDAMALAEMRAIASEVRERFGELGIAMVHRTGRVALGEPSVAVVVAAPHRGTAFDACRHAIDALKSRVPVWKREQYRDGGTAWIANTPP